MTTLSENLQPENNLNSNEPTTPVTNESENAIEAESNTESIEAVATSEIIEATPEVIQVAPEAIETASETIAAEPEAAVEAAPAIEAPSSEVLATETPSIKWEDINFPGKEFCTLSEENEICLKATPFSPQRKLNNLSFENFDTAAKILVDKFAEAQGKVDELHKLWEEKEEKLNLVGHVSKTKHYLLNAPAIGDYTPLFQSLADKESVINAQFEENLKVRLTLVEKADSMKESEQWKETTEDYRKLIDEWKVAPQIHKNKSDELWQKIEDARNHFYERKRLHHEEVEKELMINLDLKNELCEQAEALAQSEEWRKTSDKMKELLDKWKTIGRATTHEKNEELWKRFTEARNAFFDRKRQHYEVIQGEQEQNYTIKLALVEKAESLQESTEWKTTTDAHAAIMDEWKKVGRVPTDKSDELWNRLQETRDKFFTAKRHSAEEYRVNLEDNLAQKTALVNRAEQIKDSHEWRESTDEYNELMTEWKKIGFVGKEVGDALWERFLAARKHFFNRKDADRDKRKARMQSQVQGRIQQTKDFLGKLKSELQEDEERLADFKESLVNTTGTGSKDEEIRKQLQNLIQQIEKKLPSRIEKIKEVEAQYNSLSKGGNDAKPKPQQNTEEE